MAQSVNIDNELSQPFVISAIRSVRLYHVLFAIVGFVVLQAIYSIFFHPLRNVPGPFAAKLTELWRTRKYFQGNWHNDILDLHRKYGPVVRIAPNEVAFVDKEALIKVYGHSTGTKKVGFFELSATFVRLTPFVDNVVSCVGHAWSSTRRKYSETVVKKTALTQHSSSHRQT